MASSGSGYDLSASTFSPDGRIFQVEYATKAVENAGTCLGIKCKDGVVLGVGKPVLHKMVVQGVCSYKRIHHVDVHCGVASTGFVPDARVLVARAVDEAADYQETYGTKIPPPLLADRMGYYVHYFTLHGALRPFGASCVLGGYDRDMRQPTLHLLEPSGVAYSYYGVATGKGRQAAKTELEKLNLNRTDDDLLLTCRQAVRNVAKILTMLHKENKESEGKPLDLEISWICEESQYRHVGVPKPIVEEALIWAKQQLDEEASSDDDEEGSETEEGAAGGAAGAMEEG